MIDTAAGFIHERIKDAYTRARERARNLARVTCRTRCGGGLRTACFFRTRVET
ncbi:MAG: hypothetical protein ACE5GM_01400 [bacterium]